MENSLYVVFLLLVLAGQEYSALATQDGVSEDSEGTKEFLELIFSKYTKNNETSTMKISQLKDMMTDLHIGKIVDRSRFLQGVNDPDERSLKLAAVKRYFGAQIQKEKCYNVSQLLQLHNINTTNTITKLDFIRLAPSIIQQVEQGCKNKDEEGDGKAPSKIETWGCGFLSITIISFASLALVVIIPFIRKSIFYARVMSYLVALAVGTLTGDALLHLIPHSFGEGTNEAIHLYVTEDDDLKQDHAQILRALFVLLGIYAFFAVEMVMKMRGSKHGHSHGLGHNHSNGHAGHNHNNHSHSNGFAHKNGGVTNKGMEKELSAIENGDMTKDNVVICQKGMDAVSIQSVEQKTDSTDTAQITKDTSIRTVAWVVIIGDGFHNFSDGLAIGAAFSASMTQGLSTSIAIFCHELPHELGDFAVLLNAGMTMKQAIVYNLVSTICAYAGLIVGLLAGGDEIGRHFILSITAGLFLYVSLADLLPELTNEDIPEQSKICTFITHNLGICTGIGCMLLIALYEHKMLG